jgi:hypothetical protein
LFAASPTTGIIADLGGAAGQPSDDQARLPDHGQRFLSPATHPGFLPRQQQAAQGGGDGIVLRSPLAYDKPWRFMLQNRTYSHDRINDFLENGSGWTLNGNFMTDSVIGNLETARH